MFVGRSLTISATTPTTTTARCRRAKRFNALLALTLTLMFSSQFGNVVLGMSIDRLAVENNELQQQQQPEAQPNKPESASETETAAAATQFIKDDVLVDDMQLSAVPAANGVDNTDMYMLVPATIAAGVQESESEQAVNKNSIETGNSIANYEEESLPISDMLMLESEDTPAVQMVALPSEAAAVAANIVENVDDSPLPMPELFQDVMEKLEESESEEDDMPAAIAQEQPAADADASVEYTTQQAAFETNEIAEDEQQMLVENVAETVPQILATVETNDEEHAAADQTEIQQPQSDVPASEEQISGLSQESVQLENAANVAESATDAAELSKVQEDNMAEEAEAEAEAEEVAVTESFTSALDSTAVDTVDVEDKKPLNDEETQKDDNEKAQQHEVDESVNETVIEKVEESQEQEQQDPQTQQDQQESFTATEASFMSEIVSGLEEALSNVEQQNEEENQNNEQAETIVEADEPAKIIDMEETQQQQQQQQQQEQENIEATTQTVAVAEMEEPSEDNKDAIESNIVEQQAVDVVNDAETAAATVVPLPDEEPQQQVEEEQINNNANEEEQQKDEMIADDTNTVEQVVPETTNNNFETVKPTATEVAEEDAQQMINNEETQPVAAEVIAAAAEETMDESVASQPIPVIADVEQPQQPQEEEDNIAVSPQNDVVQEVLAAEQTQNDAIDEQQQSEIIEEVKKTEEQQMNSTPNEQLMLQADAPTSMLTTIIQVPNTMEEQAQLVADAMVAAAASETNIPMQSETQAIAAENVSDSMLNYVNASFIQKQPVQETLKTDPQVETFNAHLRRYDGAQVWRIVVQNDKDKKNADELQTKYDGQLWKEVKQEVDYLLKPQVLAAAERHIRSANLSRIVLIDNLQQVIEVENPPAEEIAQLQNRKGHRLTWQAYHRLEDIHGFMDYMAKTYPDICSVETIGYSVQKRALKILKISNGNATNPGIWIDGGMHAREWISPATVTFIANQLIEGWEDLPDAMRQINWYLHPVANPDGYEYSHTTDRLWRKNLRAHGRQCPGVDLNRNFGYKWGGKGTSASPCSQTYRGSKAFSEPETFYISKFISSYPRNTFQAYLSFHSYGQYILYPWGYDYHLTQDRGDLDRVARQAGTSITKSTGVKYTVGSAATTLYPAAGGSDDWARGIAGIKYTYTIEMGDTGRYGFVLPAHFIHPNGKDGYTFVETVAQAIKQRATKESRKRVF